MDVRFSSRVDLSAPNPIALAEARAAAGGVPLDRLNDSNPTRHGLAPAQVPWVYAADPRGMREARVALASFLARRGGRAAGAAEPDPDRLYLLSSTSEAYSWLFKLLCDPGDAVLAPKPGYPLIESIGRLEGVDALEYRLRFDGASSQKTPLSYRRSASRWQWCAMLWSAYA